MNINSQCDWMKDMVWTNLRFSLLMYRLIKWFYFEKTSMVFKYKTTIANVLVITPVCKPTASPGSQGKMSRAGFLQVLIANVLDRTPVCKVRAMVLPRAVQDLCNPSTQTVVLDDPCATTYKQFGKICICHIGYVTICQTGKIDIFWSSNISLCQPCNPAICQNLQLKITSTI